MAPRLPADRRQLIADMILSGAFKRAQIANVGRCTNRSVRAIASNLRRYGTPNPPPNGAGRRRKITPSMLEALQEYLCQKPGLCQDEMAIMLHDDFGILPSTSGLSRALKDIGWSKKATRHVAQERNADLRDLYVHNLSDFHSWQLIFVDESGCDKRVGFRRRGWSPLGVTPVQITRFHRDRRYQILPAYDQDGIILSRVFQGSTDGAVFEDFIEQLLQHCNPFPQPRSVLIMDNAAFHHSARIKQMCRDAGVLLVYLPPYSPDLNPIEEFFAELKAFIKKQWHEFEGRPCQDFKVFLEWCISVVGSKERSARGHFRHAGVDVEEFKKTE
jgi:transposase